MGERMARFTLTVEIPGDRWDLPVKVTFQRDGHDPVVYRTTGTIEAARARAQKTLTRMNAEVPKLPGVHSL